jgi:neutral trehalase
MQCSLAWDTIYDPIKDRVITPISRIWNCEWGGYVLYCWDTYLAAYMASLDNKELAYSNAIEITLEKTKGGFVPNCSSASGFKTLDRSQPPLGSMVILELYTKFKDIWLIEMLFDHLMDWNRWYCKAREIEDGLLALGSNPYDPIIGNYWESAGVGDIYGAAMESGLDNSPMYDEVMFDRDKSLMMLGDVGLTSLYIMDCISLEKIALIIGRNAEASELSFRAQRFSKGLSQLWCEEKGIYLNKRIDNGIFCNRISPTNFYPLLTGSIPKENSEKMIQKHFYNPDEFWGKWMIPSCPRNDPSYKDQDYWRGRIWAPLNFLVYMGLKKYDMATAMRDLAEKSEELFLKEWLENRHIHENYNADTGEGCDKPNSDKFYHWGALLSLIALIEAGY